MGEGQADAEGREDGVAPAVLRFDLPQEVHPQGPHGRGDLAHASGKGPVLAAFLLLSLERIGEAPQLFRPPRNHLPLAGSFIWKVGRQLCGVLKGPLGFCSCLWQPIIFGRDPHSMDLQGGGGGEREKNLLPGTLAGSEQLLLWQVGTTLLLLRALESPNRLFPDGP